MEYNIGFVIGDPSGDGHACTTDYHIVANHSADEISKAYKETTKLQVLILSRKLEQIFSQTIGYQKNLLKSY